MKSVPGQGWWDESPTAGPKQRPNEAFGGPLPNLQVLAWNGSEAAQFLIIFIVSSGAHAKTRSAYCPTS